MSLDRAIAHIVDTLHQKNWGIKIQFGDDGAFGAYRDIRITSAFQPIVSSDNLSLLANEALLRGVTSDGRNISPQEIFSLAESKSEAAAINRLSLAIHLLNYHHLADRGSVLHLNLDAPALGGYEPEQRAEEFIPLIEYCCIEPKQIVMEISAPPGYEINEIKRLSVFLRRRGHLIAIDNFDFALPPLGRLWMSGADMIKVNGRALFNTASHPAAAQAMPQIAQLVSEAGSRMICDGIETEAQEFLARQLGATALQGFRYAKPGSVPCGASWAPPSPQETMDKTSPPVARHINS